MQPAAMKSVTGEALRGSAHPRDASVDEGGRSLAQHGSTFHLAHLLLGRQAALDVRLLYGFFRFVDDVVDEQPEVEARRDLARIRSDLYRGSSAEPAIEGYLDFCAWRSVDRQVTDEFLAGVEQDLTRFAYATEADLLRYCYRVAGTVGLTMCALFEVDSDRALPFAIDLGIGMQLTNICRDVMEDARRGRVYLPAEMTGGALDPAELAARAGDAEARARMAVERLLLLAGRYYRSADSGMIYLPGRGRLAVLTAARCYEAIGSRVLASQSQGLPERVYVSTPARLFHMVRAAGSAARISLGALFGREPQHVALLHSALVGKPGADSIAGTIAGPSAG